MATTFDLSVHLNDFTKITRARKALLLLIANNLNADISYSNPIKLLFICTHNSRRSQLAEVLTDLLARYYDLPVDAYSGGTEATAFYHKMVEALEGFGMEFVSTGESENPVYHIIDYPAKKYFSKVYDAAENPTKNFFAFMVCDHADEACPVVTGAKYRFPLKYKDPKAFDDSADVDEVYKNKVIEIGTELNFIFHMLHKYRLNA